MIFKKKKKLSDKFGMFMSGLDKYFQDMSPHALLNIATKVSFRGKRSENLVFLGYFPEGKTE